MGLAENVNPTLASHTYILTELPALFSIHPPVSPCSQDSQAVQFSILPSVHLMLEP